MRALLLVALCLPAVIIGYAYVLLAVALQLAEISRVDTETGALIGHWRTWFARRWRYATTIGGYGIVLHSGHSDPRRTLEHERIHLRQVQDLAALALIVGASVYTVTGDWLLGLALWCSGPAWQLPNFVTALIRGGRIYRDSEHERSAYAQTVREGPETLWIDRWIEDAEEDR